QDGDNGDNDQQFDQGETPHRAFQHPIRCFVMLFHNRVTRSLSVKELVTFPVGGTYTINQVAVDAPRRGHIVRRAEFPPLFTDSSIVQASQAVVSTPRSRRAVLQSSF